MKRKLLWGMVIVLLIVGAFIWRFYEARPTVSLLDPPHGLLAAKGDGTDETEVIQAIFDYATSNHKTVLVPEGYTFLVDQILIYNQDHFSIQGLGTLKHKPNATGSILKLSLCRDFFIEELNTDGNVEANETYKDGGLDESEELHSVEIVWCGDFRVGRISDINPAADSLYIKDVVNGKIDTLIAFSDKPCGRNGLSIIMARNLTIDNVSIENIGVDGMPGGIDLEPNNATDDIEKVIINSAKVRTAYGDGIAVTNQYGSTVKDIEINGTVTKYGDSQGYVFKLNNVEDFKGNVKVYQEGYGSCTGARISGCNNIDAYLEIYNSDNGIDLGVKSSNIRLTGKIIGTRRDGISIWRGLRDSIIDMEIKNAGQDDNHGVIRISKGGTVQNTVFKGDYSYSGTGKYCFLVAGTVKNCRVRDLNTEGWSAEKRFVGEAIPGRWVKKTKLPTNKLS